MIFLLLPFLPPQPVVCLTQLALSGVMEIGPCSVVETAVRSGCCGRGEAGDLERTQEGPGAAGFLGADKAPLTG